MKLELFEQILKLVTEYDRETSKHIWIDSDDKKKRRERKYCKQLDTLIKNSNKVQTYRYPWK